MCVQDVHAVYGPVFVRRSDGIRLQVVGAVGKSQHDLNININYISC